MKSNVYLSKTFASLSGIYMKNKKAKNIDNARKNSVIVIQYVPIYSGLYKHFIKISILKLFCYCVFIC